MWRAVRERVNADYVNTNVNLLPTSIGVALHIVLSTSISSLRTIELGSAGWDNSLCSKCKSTSKHVVY